MDKFCIQRTNSAFVGRLWNFIRHFCTFNRQFCTFMAKKQQKQRKKKNEMNFNISSPPLTRRKFVLSVIFHASLSDQSVGKCSK
jgi:hypothetical protein